MSAAALERALQTAGIAAAVDPHDTLAVLIPRGGELALETPAVRDRVLRLAREHGFTHVALELIDAGAPLPRD